MANANPLIRTTAVGWVMTVVNTLLAYGVDRRIVLEELKWSPGEPAMLERSRRVPTESVLRLWHLGERYIGEQFGLMVASQVTPKTFDLLGAAIWFSRSLRDAFGRIAKYSHLIHGAGRMLTRQRGDTFELSFMRKSRERKFAPDVAIDAFSASLCAIVRQIYCASTAPVKVELQRPAPQCLEHFERAFCRNVTFGAANNVISFPLNIMDELLPGSDPAFACEIGRMIEKRLLDLGMIDVRYLVTTKILERMTSRNFSLDDIAKEMGVTARNVQFLLAEEGTCYGALLRDLRKEMALAWLEDRSLTIRAVGASLGFAEASSFARAFRDWFGISPAECRRRGPGI